MPTMLIAGGSGLIGRRLSQLLRDKGYEVLHLSRERRQDAAFPTFQWDIEAGTIDEEAIARADYAINLAGAGIADRPWSDARKELIIRSRVESTRLLLAHFQRRSRPLQAYISSAAIGYYGDRGDTLLREADAPGGGFLSESCLAWEEAIAEVQAAGIRTVAMRLGIVLSTQGGALPKMLLPVHFFTAPYFGNGRQWYSWIHIDDACRAFIHALEDNSMSGAFNTVSPQPVRNKDFMQALARAAGRPAIPIPAPAFALNLALGEMAHTVLDSTRASSEKLEKSGFVFHFSDLRPALDDLLRRKV